MLLMGDQPPLGGDSPFQPGDLDIFVSGCRTPWTPAEEHENAFTSEPLSAHGRTTNPSVRRLVGLATAFMRKLYPGAAHIRNEQREGYVNWHRKNDGHLRGHALSQSQRYTRAEVMQVINGSNFFDRSGEWAPADTASKEEWKRALESQFTEEGGHVNGRPHQLGTIVEVGVDTVPKGQRTFEPSLRDFCGLADQNGWCAPRCINIIELVSEDPIAPIDVVGGFDMLQCGVAAVPDGPSGLKFVHSAQTLESVNRRELRFSRYILGPLPTSNIRT